MYRRTYAVFLALLCSSSLGQADVLPPGKKQVEYSFVVTGFAAQTEQVLFAYPCSTSYIPSIDAYRKLEDGRPEIAGARSGACAIYTASKSSHDAFAATYQPTNQQTDPALDAFVKGATKCTGDGPTPTSYVDASDARSSINESFVVQTLTATECKLVSTTPAPSKSSSSKSCSVGHIGRASSGFALVGATLAALALLRRSRERAGRAKP